MPIRTACSACGKSLSIRDELIGKKVKCPACGNTFLAVATGVTAGEAKFEPKKTSRIRSAAEPRTKDDEASEDDIEGRPTPRVSKKAPRSVPKGLWIGIAISVLLIASALACYFLFFAGAPRTGQMARTVPSKEAKSARSVPPAEVEPIPAAETSIDPTTYPEFGPSQLIQSGIRFQEATLQRGTLPMRVWYYQPEKSSNKLALVIVPPAGSTLMAGMDLSDGDRLEHYPYVKAGFAVASFEIDGFVPNARSEAALLKGAREFRDSQAGLANARAMLDFVLAKVPSIDPNRVYIAGHSSAATLALLVAEHDPRIKACAAYAPVTDVEARLAKAIPAIEGALPGYREFLHASSPKTHASKLTCPVFLFHAEDDANVPLRDTTTFATLLKKSNSNVTLATTRQGGHFDSMVREGIPKGIAWFQQLGK